jgi:hypothetical protein
VKVRDPRAGQSLAVCLTSKVVMYSPPASWLKSRIILSVCGVMRPKKYCTPTDRSRRSSLGGGIIGSYARKQAS